MNTGEMINKTACVYTDEHGILDKARFRVMVWIMFLGESDEDQGSKEVVSDYNKGIGCVLGSGHSLISCAQFCKGKEGKPLMNRCLAVAEAKVAELSLKP